MTVTLDSKEQSELLKSLADAIRPLNYPGPAGQTYSYDILIERQGQTPTLRGERKRWSDFTSTWRDDGRLERQLVPVDFLLVELPGALERAQWDTKEREFNENAQKHLARIALNMPVLTSYGEGNTMMLLRYLEKVHDLKLRQNKVIPSKMDFLEGVYRMLGLNPTRILPKTSTSLHRALSSTIDRKALVEGLGVPRWLESAPGLSVKAVERALAILERV